MKKILLIVLIILYILAIISIVITMKPGQVIPGSYSAEKEDSSLSVFASLSAMVLVVLIALYGFKEQIKK